MNPLEEKLKNYNGGRILDVATSYGDFIRFLTETFQSYHQAIGIDTNPNRLKEAQKKSDGKIRYQCMNAEKLSFEDNYFDTVSIRHSMHHLNNIDKVLFEMKRVLKENGLFILGEVFQDPKTEKPNSHRHWHHWRAAVDRAMGEPHNDTLFKDDIIRAVESLNLKDFEIFEHFENDLDPKIITSLVDYTTESLNKLKKLGGFEDLIKRGRKIKATLEESGCIPEGVLYILGRK